MLYVLIAAVIALCGVLLYVFRAGKTQGKTQVENKVMEETLDDISTVKNARDLLARNKSMRDKLRGKYTRP